jgi:hypothetical protein
MDGAFALESVARKGDVESPVFHLDGLKNLVGVGVPNLTFVGNLIDPAVSRNVTPFGHILHCSLAGYPKKVYPVDSV